MKKYILLLSLLFILGCSSSGVVDIWIPVYETRYYNEPNVTYAHSNHGYYYYDEYYYHDGYYYYYDAYTYYDDYGYYYKK